MPGEDHQQQWLYLAMVSGPKYTCCMCLCVPWQHLRITITHIMTTIFEGQLHKEMLCLRSFYRMNKASHLTVHEIAPCSTCLSTADEVWYLWGVISAKMLNFFSGRWIGILLFIMDDNFNIQINCNTFGMWIFIYKCRNTIGITNSISKWRNTFSMTNLSITTPQDAHKRLMLRFILL